MTTAWSVTIDCRNPAALAAFWSTALGYTEPPPPGDYDSWDEWNRAHGVPEDEWDDGAFLHDPEGRLPSLSFLKVPEPKIAKNRIHLDVQVGGGRDRVPYSERWPTVEAAVAKLTAAGATTIAIIDGGDGRPDHAVLADPEGNEFCVL